MKILVSAGEASGDLHGAAVLRALKNLSPVEAFGVGGVQLQKEGLDLIVDSRNLSVMGFVEVLARVPEMFRYLGQISEAAKQRKPDVAVLIDYPDFHFLLAKRLSRLGIPVVYYIPPKVWVWRQYRIEYLRRYFKKILCIFPFEEAFYRHAKLNAVYVGNPLVQALPLGLTRSSARQQLNLAESDRILVLMPGSRRAEVAQHLEVMLQAAVESLAELRRCGYLSQDQPLRVLIPMPIGATQAQLEKMESASAFQGVGLTVQVVLGQSALCLAAADAALVKSGTSTLEAALLGCVHVLVYRPEKLNGWLFKNLIRYRGPVGLVNLILSRRNAGSEDGSADVTQAVASALRIPEILYEQVSVPVLKDYILRLLTNAKFRQAMQGTFAELKSELQQGIQPGQTPSERVAQEVFQLAQSHGLGSSRA